MGLIINELITNSLKYAFDERDHGLITIVLKEEDDTLILTIADDGVGLDPNFKKEDSFGFDLIRAFQSKLDAELEISSDEGSSITLIIKEYNVRYAMK